VTSGSPLRKVGRPVQLRWSSPHNQTKIRLRFFVELTAQPEKGMNRIQASRMAIA